MRIDDFKQARKAELKHQSRRLLQHTNHDVLEALELGHQIPENILAYRGKIRALLELNINNIDAAETVDEVKNYFATWIVE